MKGFRLRVADVFLMHTLGTYLLFEMNSRKKTYIFMMSNITPNITRSHQSFLFILLSLFIFITIIIRESSLFQM